MADGLTRDLSTAHARRRERGLWLPLPQAGEGWGEGIISIMIALSAALFSIAAVAEELPDPTRPPASVTAPVAASDAVESPPSGLQSVIISKTRRAAIIGGETVELGGKYGDAKLTEVNEGSVVLQDAQGRQVMTLFPDVKMTSKKEVKLQSPAGKAQSGKQKPVADKEGK